MTETLYLCDGAVESCTKTGCYKRGHECRHTTDAAHALNPEDKRRFVPDGDGNLWEVSSIMSVLAEKSHKFLSSEEALRDVVPPQWGKDVLSGEKKVVADVSKGRKMDGRFYGIVIASDL